MGRKIRTGSKGPGPKEKKADKKINLEKKSRISDLSIARLLLYSSHINSLKNNNIKNIQSTEIANFFSFDSAQVRKDLSYVGRFGKRGYGYDIALLKKGLDKFLFKNNPVKTVIVGIGNLGSALMGYKIFKKMGIHIIAGFDINKKIINKKINNIPVYHIDNLIKIVKKEKAYIGVISTPSDSAKKIYQLMLQADIKGIINFAPEHLTSKHIPIKNIDLSIFFETLRYELFKEKII